MAPIHAEIAELSNELFDSEAQQAFSRIARFAIVISEARRLGLQIDKKMVSDSRNSVLDLDKAIGGIGIDRLLVPTDHGYTGRYPANERAIHRPLQYALDGVLYGTRPRYSILMSCQHIEGILKTKYHAILAHIDRAPLGSSRCLPACPGTPYLPQFRPTPVHAHPARLLDGARAYVYCEQLAIV